MRAALLAAFLLLCATPAAAAATPADQRLRALYEREWAWEQKAFGRLNGSSSGAYEAYLPRVTPAAQRARLAYWTEVLAELDRIPPAELSPEERVNAEVFRAMIEEEATDVRLRAYEMPFNSDSMFWIDMVPQSGFADEDEYRRYIGRLRDVPRYFDEQVANMRAGLKRGFSVPRATLNGRDATFAPYVAAGEANPLYVPFTKMPRSIPPADQARLQAEGMAAIREAAAPAYARLLAFIRGEYLPKTRTTIGASALPDGKAYYRAQIRKYATLDIAPEEIHRIGLTEVQRITREMEATKQKAGFTGTLDQFIAFLRSDPQFYAKTPHELLGYSAYVMKKADGALAATFATLPRYRYGLIAVPDAIAPIYTSGRGGLENCMMNTYDLPSRPLYALPALTLHECTPGHSFQAALALEAPERPEFRKQLYFSGYGEGWGLYVEWLGTVMGVYETPYEDFGRLSYEMWRAARLVIDTGLHDQGWSRQQAIDYLKSHTALSQREVENEIDRYISWPGQAVSYKLGELTIRRLRTEAEAKLSRRFDQRTFHDAILQMGAVPLPVLERQIHLYIANAVASGPTMGGSE